jgi:enamine deaminase RidA (YjgF/YER057c/UK114 family)
MTLAQGGTATQARLALANSAAVLRGLGHDSRNSIGLIAYVAREDDLPLVHRICRAWLRRQTAAPAGGAMLPPLLVLQVAGLPMGAAVEAQLDASASEAETRLLGEWVEQHDSVLLRCSAAAVAAADQSGAPDSNPDSGCRDGDDGTVYRVMLQCLVDTAHEVALDLVPLASAVRSATASLLARLSPAHGAARLCGSSFTRCFYSRRLRFDVGALERSLLHSSCAGCESGAPAVMALPVERIGHGSAQMALQVHLGVVTTRL